MFVMPPYSSGSQVSLWSCHSCQSRGWACERERHRRVRLVAEGASARERERMLWRQANQAAEFERPLTASKPARRERERESVPASLSSLAVILGEGANTTMLCMSRLLAQPIAFMGSRARDRLLRNKSFLLLAPTRLLAGATCLGASGGASSSSSFSASSG